MSERAEVPPLDWGDLSVTELLPTGTVTLLLADVEGSTRLWQTQSEEMTAAFARLDRVLAELLVTHGGVRPVEQGEGDSFVLAFTRASDAVACALALQQAPLAPIRLRIGVHTGEVQLRGEGNYIGPTINRTARLRDLAHGGQTVLSGLAAEMVVDQLADGVWLTELGSHALRDLPRPERVVQLCHPDLRNEFPPLRVAKAMAAPQLPPQLTRFIGRDAQIGEVRAALADNRLVTLTGSGGVGKTRLALQVAAQIGAGVCYVDLAPITDPDLVPITVARALSIPDRTGQSDLAAVTGFVGDRRILMVLDNCEHLLDACAALILTLLGSCPGITLLATSREPIAVAGELTWRVPSLRLADEAIQLFVERARLVRGDFTLTESNAAVVAQICLRLDGIPLAIELAAARVRALSPAQIASSLHDRFRLLTGGTRTAVRRQQTLRASVDWSHKLLTDPEKALFRRLAAFMGGFDLDAGQAVAGDADLEAYQILDQLTLLVDKSLVVAEDGPGATRYRLLETVRQYAQEKLSDAGEADAVRTRHRDHYLAVAKRLDTVTPAEGSGRIANAASDLDNLRAAFRWSLDNGDIELALQLAAFLWPLWVARGLLREGADWFAAAFADANACYPGVDGATWARALADQVMLRGVMHGDNDLRQVRRALELAREIDDPELIGRALNAAACTVDFNPEAARGYCIEAVRHARALGDDWRLSQALAWQTQSAFYDGDPIAMRLASEEGQRLADGVGDRFVSRTCRWGVAWAQLIAGDPVRAAVALGEISAEADAEHDALWSFSARFCLAHALAYGGDIAAVEELAEAFAMAGDLGGVYEHLAHLFSGVVALAVGDVAAADAANAAAWRQDLVELGVLKMNRWRRAEVALAQGDLAAARSWADDAVAGTKGWARMVALTARARVAMAQGELGQAERDTHDAVAAGAEVQAFLAMPDAMECLAALAGTAGKHHEAARLLGAASAMRDRSGEVRFAIYQGAYDETVVGLRSALSDNEFDTAWAEGAALSTAEAIAYSRRGRGRRTSAATGWASLTPTELDVVELVRAGLPNKDIAARLFVSPRTVESHLSHVYAKLGLTSRMQLVQEAARRA